MLPKLKFFLLKVLKKNLKINWITQLDPWIVLKSAMWSINSSKNKIESGDKLKNSAHPKRILSTWLFGEIR